MDSDTQKTSTQAWVCRKSSDRVVGGERGGRGNQAADGTEKDNPGREVFPHCVGCQTQEDQGFDGEYEIPEHILSAYSMPEPC